MTAEIVVLNREAVAMAADSAVTSNIGKIDKISSSANKLFSLSDHHPVGIMVYGNSSFMGIPWETIIKEYRSKVSPLAGFPTLNEYATHFVSFLCYKNIKFHPFAESNYVDDYVSGLLHTIITHAFKNLGPDIDDIDEKDLSRILQDAIDSAYTYYHKLRSAYITLPQSRIVFRKYARYLPQHIKSAFKGLPLTKNYYSKVKEILIEAFSKSILDSVSSGVVFAGFGEEEFLPTVKALRIEGIVKFKQNNSELEILKFENDEDKSSSPDTSAAVIPFAQYEMVCRFMEGVDPDYQEAEDQFLSDLCKDYAVKVVSQLSRYNDIEKRQILQKLTRYGKNMAKAFGKSMQEFVRDYFTDPTVEAVGRLTKSELASMAEALVYVTSLKRKVSSDSETVTEPIDVAVISKGDGFVWIKRKHYFDPKLNPVYFIKRNMEVNNEGHESTQNSSPSAK